MLLNLDKAFQVRAQILVVHHKLLEECFEVLNSNIYGLTGPLYLYLVEDGGLVQGESFLVVCYHLFSGEFWSAAHLFFNISGTASELGSSEDSKSRAVYEKIFLRELLEKAFEEVASL